MKDNENVEVLDMEDTTSLNQTEVPQENAIQSVAEVSTQQVDLQTTNETSKESVSKKLPKYDGYRNKIIRYSICLILSLLFLGMTGIFQSIIENNVSSYTENAHSSYQVCLSKNDYYTEKCIGENLEYISEITDVIRTDFNYSILYKTKESKKYQYYIESKMKFETSDENGKELLTKTKKLTSNKKASLDGNLLNITDTVDIPFKEYDKYAEKYKSDYSLLSNVNLVVSLVLQDGKDKREVSSVTIPLTKLTYSISKKEINNKQTEYKIKDNTFLPIFLKICSVISILFIILSLIKIIKFLWKTRNKPSIYNKKLKQILNTYDRVIVTLEDKNTIVNDQEVYKVKTFLELLDVRDTIDKPILYYRVNDIKTEFYVQDINKTYKFTMKESDFEYNK